jgi:predicted cupin superfamily sugar epimerase
MHKQAKQIIENLGLIKHPEGGYYKETYRSEDKTVLHEFNGERNLCTCIYFLLTDDAFSAFHKVNQDEIWHFYQGDVIHLHMISPDGTYQMQKIGNELDKGERPQYLVPAHTWFAAEVVSMDAFALVGCTVSPGFDFKDFQLANRTELQKQFPQHKSMIKKLTRLP